MGPESKGCRFHGLSLAANAGDTAEDVEALKEPYKVEEGLALLKFARVAGDRDTQHWGGHAACSVIFSDARN